MPDIIKLLPDSVANQIAAGEVIQRPASVVKELIENSVDAGSTKITLVLRDAGKNMVKIVDNGSGMSRSDALLSFERHATSKISDANDLFAIRTMGFRGEALASIASIAEIEMVTRQVDDDTGILIEVKGGDIKKTEPAGCQQGTSISVKNLFFNVPARRKFLKTNSTELRHIINEFNRVAIINSSIEFSVNSDGNELYHLPQSNSKQRLSHIFGKNIVQQLVEINISTNLVKISGYIAKPEFAKKSPGEQFFYVNNRFMRHPYFHKAVLQAFEKVLPPETIPVYFIFLEVDPSTVDINIHPTKTEVKFENERDIWQILLATIRESLGKFNIVPSIDFDTEGMIDIPVPDRSRIVIQPSINIDPGYNPFKQQSTGKRPNYENWETLYSDFESSKGESDGISEEPDTIDLLLSNENQTIIQLKNRYILTPVKSGLMVIDQKRAHERILFEHFTKSVKTGFIEIQQQLYPITLELSPNDHSLVIELVPEFAKFGLDIREFGRNTIIISGSPAETSHADPAKLIQTLLAEYKTSETGFKESPREKVAKTLARSSAVHYGKSLTIKEMQDIIDKLFACELPNLSPDGKPVVTIISNEEIDKKFRTF